MEGYKANLHTLILRQDEGESNNLEKAVHRSCSNNANVKLILTQGENRKSNESSIAIISQTVNALMISGRLNPVCSFLLSIEA